MRKACWSFFCSHLFLTNWKEEIFYFFNRRSQHVILSLFNLETLCPTLLLHLQGDNKMSCFMPEHNWTKQQQMFQLSWNIVRCFLGFSFDSSKCHFQRTHSSLILHLCQRSNLFKAVSPLPTVVAKILAETLQKINHWLLICKYGEDHGVKSQLYPALNSAAFSLTSVQLRRKLVQGAKAVVLHNGILKRSKICHLKLLNVSLIANYRIP